MRHIAWVLMAGAAVAGLGCGGGGGTGGGSGGGSGSGGSSSAGLTINAAMGFSLTDFTAKDEPSLLGSALIHLDGHDVDGATVTINGKALVPEVLLNQPVKGCYVANPADPPVIGADLKLTIAASYSGQSASITVDCPADLTVATTPAAGAVVSANGSVTASWTTNLWSNEPALGFFEPVLEMRGYDPADKSIDYRSQPTFATMTSGAMSGTVSTPGTDKPGYLVELHVPGPHKMENHNDAICYRVKRSVFKK